MYTCLISPYSSTVPSGHNPKDYPYWQELVDGLLSLHYKVLQIGVEPEHRLVGADSLFNYPLKFIEHLVPAVDLWISVDNFFVHLATPIKPGIVLYGPSDPALFGYPQNNNLYVSSAGFRARQYDTWQLDTYNPANFVPASDILLQLTHGVDNS